MASRAGNGTGPLGPLQGWLGSRAPCLGLSWAPGRHRAPVGRGCRLQDMGAERCNTSVGAICSPVSTKPGWPLPAAAQPGSPVHFPLLRPALCRASAAPRRLQQWAGTSPAPGTVPSPREPPACRGSPSVAGSPLRLGGRMLAWRAAAARTGKGQVAAAWQRLRRTPSGRLTASGGFW